MKLLAIDLFSGVGGLSEGLRQARFKSKMAFEIDELASKAYKLNHPGTRVITQDIRTVDTTKVKKDLKEQTIHLLAGCPPCQGFSSIRRLNRATPVEDTRNDLILEYVRFVQELMPYTFMMENVPGLALSADFLRAVGKFKTLGYSVDYKVVNVRNYGVPQNRKRLVMVGSRLGPITVAKPIEEKKNVRDAIGALPSPENSKDDLHKIFPHHTERIMTLIHDIPHDGGSRKDLGESRQLACHQKENIGFNDVYGRLAWNDYSTTITGGCLNPSKGRFLHPEQDRCISAREAALLQTFPEDYKFPTDIATSRIALMIGNALPPRFCKVQAEHIREHLLKHLPVNPL